MVKIRHGMYILPVVTDLEDSCFSFFVRFTVTFTPRSSDGIGPKIPCMHCQCLNYIVFTDTAIVTYAHMTSSVYNVYTAIHNCMCVVFMYLHVL